MFFKVIDTVLSFLTRSPNITFSGLSGFSITTSTGSQFRTAPDQLFGFIAFAASNIALRLDKTHHLEPRGARLV